MPVTVSPPPIASHAPVTAAEHAVALRCFSYEDRYTVLSSMMEALDQSGCWLESRRPTSFSQMEICFTAPLSAADELYGGLIAAGVEMTRDTHLSMTWLCTLRRHRTEAELVSASVRVRMQMHFVLDREPEAGFVAAGLS